MSAQPNKIQRNPSRKAKSKWHLWEELKALVDSIPDEAFKDLPTDLSINHDHYLYGIKKQY